MTALTLDYFRGLRRGTTEILHYNAYNQGTFVWIHDRVEGDRVWGRYLYSGENLNDAEIGSYLYESDGYVCRGSGAERLYLEMPQSSDVKDEYTDEDEEDWR